MDYTTTWTIFVFDWGSIPSTILGSQRHWTPYRTVARDWDRLVLIRILKWQDSVLGVRVLFLVYYTSIHYVGALKELILIYFVSIMIPWNLTSNFLSATISFDRLIASNGVYLEPPLVGYCKAAKISRPVWDHLFPPLAIWSFELDNISHSQEPDQCFRRGLFVAVAFVSNCPNEKDHGRGGFLCILSKLGHLPGRSDVMERFEKTWVL